MNYYIFAWNESDRTLKIAWLCSEIFSMWVCECVCVIICGFSAAWAGQRVTVLDNKRCLLSALTKPVVKGRDSIQEAPWWYFVCHTAAVWGASLCVCVCVLCPLWSATDPGFYPTRLIVRFHMSSGIYCPRQAGCCRQGSVRTLCERLKRAKKAVLFLF